MEASLPCILTSGHTAVSIDSSNMSNGELIAAYWYLLATENLANTGSGNGLLPDSTKPIPEPMLTYH